ncbi:MAG: hypothetical protein AAF311_12550, partial [Pseudomonadota bacterium]
VATILFGAYRVVTAPVRVAQDTTETLTQAVEERATAVLTRRHIGVRQGRRFSRLADRTHGILAKRPASEPADLRERAFRMVNLRGSQNRVCRFDMDMSAVGGDDRVPVWTAADNADFETNRTLGGEAERQLRIVWDTADLVIGVSVEYRAQYRADDDAPRWELLWRRRDSVEKPLTDETIATLTLHALAEIAEQCDGSVP